MGMWSKLALLAAGALVGGAATRVASDPAARQSLARAVQGSPEQTAVARTGTGDVAHRPRPARRRCRSCAIRCCRRKN